MEVRIEIIGGTVEEGAIIAVIGPVAFKPRIAVLRPSRQVVGEGVFDTCTKGPAPLGSEFRLVTISVMPSVNV